MGPHYDSERDQAFLNVEEESNSDSSDYEEESKKPKKTIKRLWV